MEKTDISSQEDQPKNNNPTTPQLVSINLICRLCANEIQNNKLIGIYSEDGLNNDLPNKMNMYLPIKVSENDELPQQCCWDCASTVLAWHDLFVASIEADRRLRNCELYSYHSRESKDNSNGIKKKEEDLNDLNKNDEDTNFSMVNIPINDQLDRPDLITLVECPNSDSISIKKENDANKIDDTDLNDFSFSCQFCSLIFVTESEAISHIHEVHSDEIADSTSGGENKDKRKKDKRKKTKIDQALVDAAKVVVEGRAYYRCQQCGKSLHSPYTYMWHMRIHTGERPYVCDLCGKQFRISQGLARHLKETHEGIKKFPCDLCGRKFATRRNVVEHRRTHTNERPYVCDFCGKAFKQKASLFVHNRSHSDLFPFKCPHCPQAYRAKTPMLLHLTIHTGEKPYSCDICGRSFRIKFELKRHKLIHSDEKPFSCDECGLRFRQKRYLRRHNDVNHPRGNPT